MTTTKSSPAKSLREARDKLRARVVPQNNKPIVVTKDEYSAFEHASFALRERLVTLRRDLAEAEKFKVDVCLYHRFIEDAENALTAIDSMWIRASVEDA
ncbi:hypothetical protein C942_00849 [Photobacterium marinum]|uniref:Uncharacterized protein n=1 Tax=Photobacterium marinum TaxID=1056511 RepID=L8JBZ3_9GAMM|nr:hypothetical protein [Photobacterium marinum]ELR65763.1 hypothetical protein C942_00849 [Photobacterium marinum]